jgi:Cof subfamily protein (haloacid dehalogenase superfamily)
MPRSLATIFLDVDGTLTNSLREVTPRTQAALMAYQAAGGVMTLSTGRSLSECQGRIFHFFPAERIHILNSGSQLARGTGEVVWEINIESNIVKEICQRVLSQSEAWFNFQQGTQYFTSPNLMSPKAAQGFNVASSLPGESPIGSTESGENWETPRLSAGNLDADTILWIQKLKNISTKEMVSSRGELYFDITPLGQNKATGAQRWSEIHGVNLSDCIAVGDGGNDRDILQAVGRGVAMGNATDSVKSVADEVIGHTDEDGLAIFIEELLSA